MTDSLVRGHTTDDVGQNMWVDHCQVILWNFNSAYLQGRNKKFDFLQLLHSNPVSDQFLVFCFAYWYFARWKTSERMSFGDGYSRNYYKQSLSMHKAYYLSTFDSLVHLKLMHRLQLSCTKWARFIWMTVLRMHLNGQSISELIEHENERKDEWLIRFVTQSMSRVREVRSSIVDPIFIEVLSPVLRFHNKRTPSCVRFKNPPFNLLD